MPRTVQSRVRYSKLSMMTAMNKLMILRRKEKTNRECKRLVVESRRRASPLTHQVSAEHEEANEVEVG